MTTKQDIASGARRVEETEHMAAGLETPGDLAARDLNMVSHVDAEKLTAGPSDTPLGEAVLGMFQKGNSVQVRIGSPTNSAELYEGTFDSAEDANAALIDAGILQQSQIANPADLAGTGIHVTGLTTHQLEGAGIKRKSNPTI